MRIRTLTIPQLQQRIRIIERSQGRHCMAKLSIMYECCIEANLHELAEQTNDAIQRQDVCGVSGPPQTIWSDTSICPGACATLKLISPSGQVFTLTAPGAVPPLTEISDSVTLCFPTAGDYDIFLDDGNCIRTQLTYTVRQRVPGPVLLSDTLICPGECIIATSPEAAGSDDYFWTFEGGEPESFSGLMPPQICFDSVGTYAIRLNIVGCGFSEAELVVSSMPYMIPNAFTPNGDGANDIFRPLLECPSGEYQLAVYNRWGQKVFSSNNPNDGWDGTHEDEDAPSDVYVWVLSFGEIGADGQVLNRTEKGGVTLLR